jgi:hypothetical protein
MLVSRGTEHEDLKLQNDRTQQAGRKELTMGYLIRLRSSIFIQILNYNISSNKTKSLS